MSAAATLNSSCSTLDAPGMATTGQAGPARPGPPARLGVHLGRPHRATSYGSGSMRRRFSVPNNGFNAHPAGPVVHAVLAAEQATRASRLWAICQFSRSANRDQIVQCARWASEEYLIADHRPPSAASAFCHRASGSSTHRRRHSRATAVVELRMPGMITESRHHRVGLMHLIEQIRVSCRRSALARSRRRMTGEQARPGRSLARHRRWPARHSLARIARSCRTRRPRRCRTA